MRVNRRGFLTGLLLAAVAPTAVLTSPRVKQHAWRASYLITKEPDGSVSVNGQKWRIVPTPKESKDG